jgi:hypothetical protein
VPVLYEVNDITYPVYSTGSGTISRTITAGVSAANAIATNAFGNYNDIENDQTYIGWTHYYFPNNFRLEDTKWTKKFWGYLGQGYSVAQIGRAHV